MPGLFYDPNDQGSGQQFHAGLGDWGGIRHQGYFSPQNPYFNQMKAAANDEDYDAAYSLAVQWEADYANLQEQRAYDREVLEEQRAYDHPLAELQRQRAAGYNPDIAAASSGGSTGSGSSAQLAQREISDQEPTSPFKNSYDDSNRIFNGINAITGVIGSVASAYSGITSGIATMRKLPGEMKLIESQANTSTAYGNLANTQANEIISLLEGKKEYQSLLNTAQGITNANNILSSLMSLSDRLNPNSDISPILTAMGVSDDQHSAYSSAFGELMKNPQAVARFHRGNVDAKRAIAEDSVATEDYFRRAFSTSYEIEQMSLDIKAIQTRMNKSIQSYLDASSYVTDTAEALVVGASNSNESVKLAHKQIERDVLAYANYLNNISHKLNSAYSRADVLSKKEKLNARENIELKHLREVLIPSLDCLGSQSTSELNSIARELERNAFLSNNASFNLNGQDITLQNLSLYWGDVVYGAKSSHDIATDWTSQIIGALGAMATGYAGYKIGNKPQMSSQTITDMAPGYDGQMQTTNRRTIQNIY